MIGTQPETPREFSSRMAEARARRGSRVGRKPYGFFPGEKAVVALIKRHRLINTFFPWSKGSQPWGYRLIAGYLNSFYFCPRYGDWWQASTMWNIVNKNPFYGEIDPKDWDDEIRWLKTGVGPEDRPGNYRGIWFREICRPWPHRDRE